MSSGVGSAAERSFETACGRVSATAPVPPAPYWRLDYYQDGKRRQTTGGRTRPSAEAKAKKILERLDAHAGPKARVRLGEALEAYVAYIRRTKAANTSIAAERDLRKALGGYEQLRCENLARHHVTDACQATPTQCVATHRRSHIRTFLRWGYGEEYFTDPQTRLLDNFTWVPTDDALAQPPRIAPPTPSGESVRFVTPDEVPSHQAIERLGDALDELLGYGKLLVEFTAASGLRGGELYALSSAALYPADREVAVNWQMLSVPGLASRKQRPKHGKVRTTNYPAETLNGFDLHGALEQRLAEVEVEYEQGRNRDRLLFPAPKGGPWWATSFTNKYFSQAAEVANWDCVTWVDEKERPRRRWVHTMHSLRHRFARDRIDTYGHTMSELQVVGGWSSAQVVLERYYGRSSELLGTSGAKLGTKKTGP